MIQTDPIFLGVVPRGARNYVAEQIVRLDRPFFNACGGRFSVVEAAVKQGFPAANVHASDIGLFSSIIGYLADDSKRLEDLGIRILDPDLEPRDVRDDRLRGPRHADPETESDEPKEPARASICVRNYALPGGATARPCAMSLLAWLRRS